MNLLVSVEVYNGLANRLRALWSAVAYSKRYSLPARIRWPISADFPTSHQRLIICPASVRISDAPLTTPSQLFRFRLERLLLSGLGLGFERRRSIPWVTTFQPRKPRFPLYWLRSCEEFHPMDQVACPFEPSAEVSRIVEQRWQQIHARPASLIGLHIRRGDHSRATECSPIRLFSQRIHEIHAADPGARFLICSDDPQEITNLQTIHGPELILAACASVLPRQHRDAAVQAMADLVMLSRCRCILGSHMSSFSTMAGLIGAKEVEEVSVHSATAYSATAHKGIDQS